jgi:hypothetical protein
MTGGRAGLDEIDDWINAAVARRLLSVRSSCFCVTALVPLRFSWCG